ncbi:hypothetical protein V5799_010495 [Amblyomma americanum]|uniref:Uncharacterized protein n=1 Tax=Amblyomma americanum TaxID=6943 RepID=A0AAQ4EJP4_AMBAM
MTAVRGSTVLFEERRTAKLRMHRHHSGRWLARPREHIPPTGHQRRSTVTGKSQQARLNPRVSSSRRRQQRQNQRLESRLKHPPPNTVRQDARAKHGRWFVDNHAFNSRNPAGVIASGRRSRRETAALTGREHTLAGRLPPERCDASVVGTPVGGDDP